MTHIGQPPTSEISAPTPSPHPSLPIVAHSPVRLDAQDRRYVSQIATRLLANEPALHFTTEAFGSRVSAGADAGPSLLLQDLEGVALVTEPVDSLLQYRMLWLAQEGDQVVLSIRRSPAFETYCREHLHLGRVDIVSPVLATPNKSLATCCRQDRTVLARLVARARQYGRLNIQPHIGTGAVWALAATIAAQSGASVRVAAPPPRLTQRVNDKLWFAQCVSMVLGPRAMPPSYFAFGPAALTRRVATLAKTCDQVAIKVPNSSGSMGNLTLASSSLRHLSVRVVRQRLLALLHELGWRNTYPLLVSVWECPVVVSPSVQMWIPEKEYGDPVVEGVFNQVVEGPVGEFIGAMPSTLPEAWRLRLAQESLLLGALFQELGYFGRCSFDAILVGEALDSAALHWIECNGRWGGASIPMTLANRLIGDWSWQPFVVVQRGRQYMPYKDFTAVLERLKDLLLRPRESVGGVVPLIPGRFENGTGIDFMVLSDTLATARRDAVTVTELLTAERSLP